jgi:hypothetical protein
MSRKLLLTTARGLFGLAVLATVLFMGYSIAFSDEGEPFDCCGNSSQCTRLAADMPCNTSLDCQDEDYPVCCMEGSPKRCYKDIEGGR